MVKSRRESIAPTSDAAAAGRAANGAPEGRPWPPLCGDIDMRIDRDGRWYYQGSPIGRLPLVKLFASVLRRGDDARYYLVTPVERCLVTVEDAPFVAVELTKRGHGKRQTLTFRTNLDDEVTADADHPIRVAHDENTAEPSPYVRVRDGLDALIARPVYYELVECGEECTDDNGNVYGVWSAGTFFPLGRLDEA